MECTHHNQQEVLRQEEDVVVPKDSSGDAFSQEDGVLPESLRWFHIFFSGFFWQEVYVGSLGHHACKGAPV